MTLSWLSFSVAMLKVAYAVINWFSRRQLIDEGRRQIILEISLSNAAKLADKKKIQEYVDGLTDAEVDRDLRNLEPQ